MLDDGDPNYDSMEDGGATAGEPAFGDRVRGFKGFVTECVQEYFDAGEIAEVGGLGVGVLRCKCAWVRVSVGCMESDCSQRSWEVRASHHVRSSLPNVTASIAAQIYRIHNTPPTTAPAPSGVGAAE